MKSVITKKQYLHKLILKKLGKIEEEYYSLNEEERVDAFLEVIKDVGVQKMFWIDFFSNEKSANIMLLLFFDGIVDKFRPKLVFDIWDCLVDEWKIIQEVVNYIEFTSENIILIKNI